MTLRSRLAGLTVAAVCVAGQAGAGLLDSPAPTFANGQTATVVYRMGAVHYEPGGWVDTTVTCKNIGLADAQLALEIFDEADRLAGRTTEAAVAPGAGVTFATSADAGAAGAVTVAALPPLDHGKARVSASTTQVSCNALHRLRAADGTVKESALELIKKVAY